MRSNLVFSAALKTPNRYMLCRVISMSVRRVLNRPGSFAEGINSCLVLAGNDSAPPPAQAVQTGGVTNLRMLEAL